MEVHGYPVDRPPADRCLPFPPPDRGVPEEPEPDAGDLDLPIDWMGYSHEELYRMVHDNVNLAGAEEVAEKWADLRGGLISTVAGLRAIVESFHAAWTGEAADQARAVFVDLLHWTQDTSNQCGSLYTLVNDQAGHVKVARDAMPAPIRAMPGQPEQPLERAPANDGTTPMSAGPFASGGFGGATSLVADSGEQRQLFLDRHRQAAEVMERLQRDSSKVYQEVPEFTPPRRGPGIFGDPDDPPKEPPRPDPEQPEPDDGTDASNVGGGSAPPTGVGGPAPGGSPAPGTSLPPNAPPAAEQYGA
ncbi:WXG100 family type VII secretion target, partial [Amycolatopsis cihanbeyliensis]